MKAQKPEEKLYNTGVKEAGKLELDYSKKAGVIQKAYEAAAAELGYSDKQLMDPSKAKKVAKLMFSGKYLGNAEFNPLVGDDFKDRSEIDQQRTYEHKLGLNLDSFVKSGGIIDRYGGLRRGTIANAVESQFGNQATQQLMAMAWQNTFDPDKPLEENIKNYTAALQADPILAHTGAKLDAGKFESIDDVAQALATSFMGKSSREGFEYRHGVNF